MTRTTPTPMDARPLAVAHGIRFRRVATRYPRAVAEAYSGDIARAAADTDAQVAAIVAEWERGHGLEPCDWRAIGRSEREIGDHYRVKAAVRALKAAP